MNRGPDKSLPKWASSPPKYEGPQTPSRMDPDKDEDIEDVVGFLIDITYICKFHYAHDLCFLERAWQRKLEQ